MEEADEPGEVGGTNSELVSPGANKHKESVEGDKAVNETHKTSNEGQLGASSLAVDIAIINHVDVVSEVLTIDL